MVGPRGRLKGRRSRGGDVEVPGREPLTAPAGAEIVQLAKYDSEKRRVRHGTILLNLAVVPVRKPWKHGSRTCQIVPFDEQGNHVEHSCICSKKS